MTELLPNVYQKHHLKHVDKRRRRRRNCDLPRLVLATCRSVTFQIDCNSVLYIMNNIELDLELEEEGGGQAEGKKTRRRRSSSSRRRSRRRRWRRRRSRRKRKRTRRGAAAEKEEAEDGGGKGGRRRRQTRTGTRRTIRKCSSWTVKGTPL